MLWILGSSVESVQIYLLMMMMMIIIIITIIITINILLYFHVIIGTKRQIYRKLFLQVTHI